MQLRQRKLTSEGDNVYTSAKGQRPRKTSSNSPYGKYRAVILVLGLLLLGYVVIANDLKPLRAGSKAIDSLAFSFNFQKPSHVVIIDAGSTGSRVVAFSFHSSIMDGNVVLDSELFHEIKPGLSSFAEEPEQGAKHLQQLLDLAKTRIPEADWSRTPLSMRATAGLRLLSEHKANALLNSCRTLFDTSGFQVSKESVTIMEGTDEGIFSWFTVNFLLDRFSGHDTSNTVAALDLGGGSTQVTFIPDDDAVKKLDKYVYNINALNHNMSLYTHSYLGMGLMYARKAIITAEMDEKDLESSKDQLIVVRSKCINPIVSRQWTYSSKNYLVKGPINETHKTVKTQNFAGAVEDRPIVNFTECRKIVDNYVNTIVDKPLGLNKHEIYAFSYYFERATEVGLIDPFKGGEVTVNTFLKAAREACEYPNVEQPFMCLDLTFIYVLLREGFGLEGNTKMFLFKKINNHELSWALGAAFNILQNGL